MFVCPADVLEGRVLDQKTRKEFFGSVAGGAGSRGPEIFQRKKIEEGTGVRCLKTNMRINLRTCTMKEIAKPNVFDDGFDYTEDFDGCQIFGSKKVYLNLKCVSDSGGNQTRSLREVHHLIEGSLMLLTKGLENVYFANILDGDEAHKHMKKFERLINLPDYVAHKDKIYVGDLKGYFTWLSEKMA